MYFVLNKKQKEFLYSRSYSELKECGFHKSTVTFLRKTAAHMQVETLAKILKVGFDSSLEEFMNLR